MSKHDIGDGDTCPLNPEHGHMFWLRGYDRQYCPNHSHEMRGERVYWPQGYKSFADAVADAPVPALPDLANLEV